MKCLAIDTSTMTGSVALTEDERLVAELSLQVKETHSARLLPAIDQVLCSAHWQLREVDLLAVSLGPGSFTGLRIGLATMKGLAMALDRPLVGVPTLDAMAAALPFCPYPMCPMIDARMKEVYAAWFSWQDNQLSRLSPYQAATVEQILASEFAAESSVVVFGSGAEVYAERIVKAIGRRAIFPPPTFFHPRAAMVAEEAHKLFQQAGFTPTPLHEIEPLYVRRAQAELRHSVVGPPGYK